jgi:hypothetical protein
MDKSFCVIQHDDVSRKDLFQVMEAFSKVKDTDRRIITTLICEPDRHTNEQGVDDADGDDIDSSTSNACQDQYHVV